MSNKRQRNRQREYVRELIIKKMCSEFCAAGAYFKLCGKKIIPTTLYKWGVMFEKEEARRVAYDEIDEAYVSTVFLGIDHSFGSGTPLFFETMAFKTANDDEHTRRYYSWDEAEAGHKEVCAEVRGL